MAKLDKIREIVRDLETPRICFSPRSGFSMESMADRYNMTIRDTESEIEIQDFADNNKPVTWAWDDDDLDYFQLRLDSFIEKTDGVADFFFFNSKDQAIEFLTESEYDEEEKKDWLEELEQLVIDDPTKEYSPYHSYENFDTYVPANMKYLEKAEGYKFFTIKDKLVSRLLNKDLIEESEFPQYAELLKNYEAEFTYDDEDPIEGYDDITGEWTWLCRTGFTKRQ